MREKQPQIALSRQACLKAATSGPSSEHMIAGIHVHRQAVQRIFGEHDEVHRRHVAPRLADHRDDALRLRAQIVGRRDDRQLQLHDADDDAVRAIC